MGPQILTRTTAFFPSIHTSNYQFQQVQVIVIFIMSNLKSMTTNHQRTEVYRFLIFLQKYLLGDLDLFHQLATNAEMAEQQAHQNASPAIPGTKNPYSFEFLFGDPIISRSTLRMPDQVTNMVTKRDNYH